MKYRRLFRDSLVTDELRHHSNRRRSHYRPAASLLFVPKLAPNEAVDRQWSGTTDDQRCEQRQIQEIGLITWLTELRTGRGDGFECDRTEAVRQMHRKHGDQ